jgi:hypothetical protein
MEQTSSSAYPNILVVDYVKKARVASPELLLKSENYLNIGYQKLLTFERPGGGFDWWGSGEPLVWLSAYGLMEFADMAKVYPIDKGIIDRTQNFLLKKMDADGTWSNIGATHGETIASMGNPKLLLTSYVSWALLDSGLPKDRMTKSITYIRDHIKDAGDNAYILALAANALASYDAKDDSTLQVLQKLEALRKDVFDNKGAEYPTKGTSLTYAHGNGANVEATALTALAMIRTGQFANSANKALVYLIKVKGSNGTWGSTAATILSLKALVASVGSAQHKGETPFSVLVNGKEVGSGKITEENADVMQVFDLKEVTRVGDNTVEIKAKGETSLMYQIVGRHYAKWTDEAKPVKKSPLEVTVSYDRTQLSTTDTLKAKATLKYHGEIPTYMVMIDLGIAPGFTVDPGDFAEMVGKKQIQRFTVTPSRVTLYLGDVKPGDVLHFEYALKAKYPLRAQTPPTTAWEYYTPTNRAVAAPTRLTVTEKK